VNRRLLVAAFVIAASGVLVSSGAGQSGTAGLASSGTTAEVAPYRALLDQYCVVCHNPQGAAGDTGLFLDQLDLTHLDAHREQAEDVLLRLRSGLMPPRGMRRPEPEALESLISWMETELDRTAETHLPAPGLHRLNRTEYANAIRDLLDLEVDASKFLPSDDSSHGFDNMAGTLTMSPALMEAYLTAAGKISRLAIGSETAPTMAVFDVPVDTAQNYHIEGLPFGTRGGMLIEHEFPADGEYALTVKGITGYFTSVLGEIQGEKLEVTVDGERVYLFDWDSEIGNTEGNGGRTPLIPISAGFHTVGVTFLATNDLPGTELNQPFLRTMISPGHIPGYKFYPHVGQVFLEGPFNGVSAAETPSREKIFTCRPPSSGPDVEREEGECARRIVSTLLTNAFRRPPTDEDMEVMMEFYLAGREEGTSFDAGVEAALQRILADPEFIYRGEREPVGLAEGETYRLDGLELASRLSFFLWSSIPDDELIALASQGRLSDEAVLEQQVARMIADPRSSALVENFTGQWLNVRGMQVTEPVVEMFPNFDSNLRAAYRREVELFFDSIIREDRSVIDLLTADYTFVNERLAKQYGIPDLYGSQFRRVTLGPDLDMRRGLLGKGALLTVTSQAARTSPVKRGKWFLETFLGVSPPDPPPGVEINLEQDPNKKPTTLRERLEAHHTNPVCNSCHQIFEPMGLAMENFDAVGAWRTEDSGSPVDATGVAPNGTALDGVQSLRELILQRPDQFAQVVAEKMLTYALGRGVEDEDMPLVRSIVRDMAENDYRFSSLLLGIVRSPAFQMNMRMTETEPQQLAAQD
jgi:mono/diheme cytochrome c family protein